MAHPDAGRMGEVVGGTSRRRSSRAFYVHLRSSALHSLARVLCACQRAYNPLCASRASHRSGLGWMYVERKEREAAETFGSAAAHEFTKRTGGKNHG